MGDGGNRTGVRDDTCRWGRDAVQVALVGVLLGIAFNFIGLRSKPAFGLDWIAVPVEETVYKLPEVDGSEAVASAGAAAEGYAEEDEYIDNDDPMGVFQSPGDDREQTAQLPAIPVLPRPIQIQMNVAKQFYDAGAAQFIDSRDEEEYLAGHLPGSLHLPFHLASDPDHLAKVDPNGGPIIVYCGGGECETSIEVAWFLIEAGYTRVTYFPNGYQGWADEGYPVENGPEEGNR